MPSVSDTCLMLRYLSCAFGMPFDTCLMCLILVLCVWYLSHVSDTYLSLQFSRGLSLLGLPVWWGADGWTVDPTFSRGCHFQKSDPLEAAPLQAPCLKIANNCGKPFNILKGVSFSKNQTRQRQHPASNLLANWKTTSQNRSKF